MPPKIKITKNEIIETALELIRANGVSALNARSIASALSCSTQPIFSNFDTMEDLHNAVLVAARERYLRFLRAELEQGIYPPYKSFGMAYIRFAKEEKELFYFLFLRDTTGVEVSPTADYEQSIEMIMSANGVSRETASLMHLEMWACVHGIGTMLATSYISLDWELISQMLSDVYTGLQAKHARKEENT